jgi:hypothetical protein
MRKFLTVSGRCLSVGWFWAFVLLVLPNCGLETGGLGGPANNLFRGSSPHTAAIMCDIEKGRHCATDAEKKSGIRLASAAEALVAGQTSNIGLDDSPAALARCATITGGPEAVEFRGAFPKGYAVCLNCGDTLGAAFYPDANAVCVAQCEDFFGTTTSDGAINPNVPPLPADKTFCEGGAARASTNFPLHDCYAGACSTAGALKPDFPDPRIVPEQVTWQDVTGNASAGPGTLSRSGATSGMWDAGADSTQVITGGDGYVEFVADTNNLARMGGLSGTASPETTSSFTDIGYGIDLFSNGQISIFESGTMVQAAGAYLPNDRFRVKVTDNFDGTATISYAKVTGPCVDGSPCAEAVFYTSLTHGAYPFRVDASLFDQNAALTQVRIVRIH